MSNRPRSQYTTGVAVPCQEKALPCIDMPVRPETIRFDDSRRFELLVRGVTDCAIYMLDPDGFITSWNSGAERITGYREAEILGEHFGRFFTEEDQKRHLPRQMLSQARDN